MRVSELSRVSDVPLATIKYYLREGLLHDGVRTSATQASYDETHVARLRMVRALGTVGGMSLARIKAVLAAVDDPPETMHDLLGIASLTAPDGAVEVGDPLPDEDDGRGHARAHRLLRDWGWEPADTACASHLELAAALDALEDAGISLGDLAIDDYRDHMTALAADEVGRTPTTSREDAVRYVALGVPLVEPLLLALRRLGHQRASARVFAESGAPALKRVSPGRPRGAAR